jgi:hypothetical protein
MGLAPPPGRPTENYGLKQLAYRYLDDVPRLYPSAKPVTWMNRVAAQLESEESYLDLTKRTKRFWTMLLNYKAPRPCFR